MSTNRSPPPSFFLSLSCTFLSPVLFILCHLSNIQHCFILCIRSTFLSVCIVCHIFTMLTVWSLSPVPAFFKSFTFIFHFIVLALFILLFLLSHQLIVSTLLIFLSCSICSFHVICHYCVGGFHSSFLSAISVLCFLSFPPLPPSDPGCFSFFLLLFQFVSSFFTDVVFYRSECNSYFLSVGVSGV